MVAGLNTLRRKIPVETGKSAREGHVRPSHKRGHDVPRRSRMDVINAIVYNEGAAKVAKGFFKLSVENRNNNWLDVSAAIGTMIETDVRKCEVLKAGKKLNKPRT